MWKFPGASTGWAAAAVCAVWAPALADSGAAAFARKDYPAAAALWRAEAGAGSAEAAFGLGLIHDLGLGQPVDPAAALRWYLVAAAAGHADAAFNAGVMLDAGIGAAPDRGQAALWYARAAVAGHLRAAFNLGLLYESGTGVPQNPDLARFWFGQAEHRLAAARQRLTALPGTPDPVRGTGNVRPLAGTVTRTPDGEQATLVWTASPGPAGSAFLAEVGTETGGEATPSLAVRTQGSAVRIALPPELHPVVWRVGRITAEGQMLAPGAWHPVERMDAVPAPVATAGRVTIHVNPGDRPARAFAAELAASFAAAGLEVRVQEAARPAAVTAVAYRYDSDAGLAAAVAGFLPVLEGSDATMRPDLDSERGEVSVWLVGGPTPLRARG